MPRKTFAPLTVWSSAASSVNPALSVLMSFRSVLIYLILVDLKMNSKMNPSTVWWSDDVKAQSLTHSTRKCWRLSREQLRSDFERLSFRRLLVPQFGRVMEWYKRVDAENSHWVLWKKPGLFDYFDHRLRSLCHTWVMLTPFMWQIRTRYM